MRHTVVPGESLWSIADDELGDPTLWPELFDVNQGRTFGDGRMLVDPALLRPGWDLVVPVEVPGEIAAGAPAVTDEQERPDPLPERVVVDHDAHHVNATAVPEMEVVSRDDVAPADVDGSTDAARPENVWTTHGDADAPNAPPSADAIDDDEAPQLLTIRRAVMLVGGVLTLVAVRRRRRLREAPPRPRLPEPAARVESIERELRNIVAGEHLARVDLAIRAATLPLIESGQRMLAALASPEGSIEIVASGPASLPAMWQGADDRWVLPASVPLETVAADARQVNAPCPALVQLGIDDSGRDVYVDLEAVGALEVGGSATQQDAVVAAIAATLAGSVLAEVTTLVSVGVPADAFLGHRLHTAAADVEQAYELARRAVGAMSGMQQPVFELRARGTAGESWDPAVILVGSGAGTVQAPSHDRMGLAVVSASPIEGPSSTLRPDGDAWLLRPLGLRVQPVGLVPDDLSAISELVNVAPVVGDDSVLGTYGELDVDCTIYATEDGCDGDEPAGRVPTIEAEPDWDLMVRLFGSVE